MPGSERRLPSISVITGKTCRLLEPHATQRLLEGFDRRTVLGKRDYAMVLCLARLGLRAGEVARLSLEDVDWRNGWLRLAAPKGRRERHCRCQGEVGQALASYLRSAPPNQTTRLLFRTVGDQRRCAVAGSPSAWHRYGARRLGAPGKRAHLLRRLLPPIWSTGASLKAVADLLDHASLSTTQAMPKSICQCCGSGPAQPGEVRP